MKILLKYIIFLLIFVSCETERAEFISYKNLNKDEAKQAHKYFNQLKAANPFFEIIISQLQKNGQKIVVKFSDKVKIAGFQNDKQGKYILYFKSLDDFRIENSIVEEFFHAFQSYFYGSDRLRRNADGQVVGAVNLEYEARLLKAIIAVFLEKPFSETPSQKGLLEFTMSLLDEKGRINCLKLNNEQHKNYISLVNHFQNHWEKRNEMESIKSIYDHPVDSLLGPEACFYVLKLYKEKYSK